MALNRSDGSEAFRINDPEIIHGITDSCPDEINTPIIVDDKTIITLNGQCSVNTLSKYDLDQLSVDKYCKISDAICKFVESLFITK